MKITNLRQDIKFKSLKWKVFLVSRTHDDNPVNIADRIILNFSTNEVLTGNADFRSWKDTCRKGHCASCNRALLSEF